MSGPVAIMHGASGTSSASAHTAVMLPCDLIFSVIKRANLPRSTASAPPAGTAETPAACMVSEPSMRISSFKSPHALPNTSLLLSELEHTSSAKSALECAGVNERGFMSASSTENPSSASRHAASHPASPAPTTLILSINPFHRLRRSLRGRERSSRTTFRNTLCCRPF